MKTLSTEAVCLCLFALLPACGASQSSDTRGVAAGPGSGPVAVAPADSPASAPGGGAAAQAPVDAAPDFTLPDLDGNQVTLSSLRGKIVVLEWFNPECPFVRYAHSDGPLRVPDHQPGRVVTGHRVGYSPRR